jgi:hypothetical protein
MLHHPFAWVTGDAKESYERLNLPIQVLRAMDGTK